MREYPMVQRWHRRTSSILVALVCVVVAAWANSQGTASGPGSTAVEGSAQTGVAQIIAPGAGGPDFNAAHVEGEVLCVDCHRAEVAHWNSQWRESGHGWGGYEYITGRAAAQVEKYGKALGIEASELKTHSLCVKCHATPQLSLTAHMQPIMGVSCEACHNPSGGEDGWLNAHAVYGPPGTGRYEETLDHFHERVARTTTAGQLRAADLYSLAERCYACHIVGNQELVDAGHQAIGEQFDHLWDGLKQPMIRHNFHENQRENEEVSSLWLSSPRGSGRTADNRKRMIYVVGELAKLESLLRHMIVHYQPDADNDFVLDMAEALELDDEDELEEVLGSIDSQASRRLHEALVGVVGVLEEDEEVPQDEDGWLVDSLEIVVEADYADLSEDPRPALTTLADALRGLGKDIAAGNGTELETLDLRVLD